MPWHHFYEIYHPALKHEIKRTKQVTNLPVFWDEEILTEIIIQPPLVTNSGWSGKGCTRQEHVQA